MAERPRISRTDQRPADMERPGCAVCHDPITTHDMTLRTNVNGVAATIHQQCWKGADTMPMPKPKTEGHYLKAPKAGQSLTLRILADPVEYYLGFKTGAENKISVTRRKTLAEFKPTDYDAVDKYGRRASPAYCMAFAVLNEDNEVKVCEFRQKTILDSLYQLENNKKWGDLTTFDVTITADDDGKGYSVTPDPKTPISDEGRAKWEALVRNGFDLNVLLSGGDPFMVSGESPEPMQDDITNPKFDDENEVPF